MCINSDCVDFFLHVERIKHLQYILLIHGIAFQGHTCLDMNDEFDEILKNYVETYLYLNDIHLLVNVLRECPGYTISKRLTPEINPLKFSAFSLRIIIRRKAGRHV